MGDIMRPHSGFKQYSRVRCPPKAPYNQQESLIVLHILVGCIDLTLHSIYIIILKDLISHVNYINETNGEEQPYFVMEGVVAKQVAL